MIRCRLLYFVLTLGLLPFQISLAACFSDSQLQQLTTLKADAFIYVWSPHMVLSAVEAGNVKTTANAQGLTFIALHDAHISNEEIAQSFTKLPIEASAALQASQPLCSDTLLANEAWRHFPSGFVVHHGLVNTLPIVGAMPPSQWQELIQNRLSTACIPQNEFVPLSARLAGTKTDSYGNTTVALGSYERISPDGRFILRSFSGARIGDVSLIEFSQVMPTRASSVTKIYETPLSNEAFPIQGTWRYIVSTAGEHYAFKDMLLHERNAKPLFQGGMTGFYAAASELLDSDTKPDHIRIRSFAWPNAIGDANSQGEGSLAVRTLTVNSQTQKIVADTGYQNICSERAQMDGTRYALPMISVDGEEFAALPQTPMQGAQTMRIYGFGKSGRGCESRTNFDFASGKTIFGFPENGLAANLAYAYKAQTWWFNRALNQPFNITPYLDENSIFRKVDASAFPGITHDGRVIYAATWERCNAENCKPESGYIIADPYQSNAYLQYVTEQKITPLKTCISYADVARERRAFAFFHHLDDRDLETAHNTVHRLN